MVRQHLIILINMLLVSAFPVLQLLSPTEMAPLVLLRLRIRILLMVYSKLPLLQLLEVQVLYLLLQPVLRLSIFVVMVLGSLSLSLQ